MEKAMIKKQTNKQNTTNKKACKMEVASLWGTIFLWYLVEKEQNLQST